MQLFQPQANTVARAKLPRPKQSERLDQIRTFPATRHDILQFDAFAIIACFDMAER